MVGKHGTFTKMLHICFHYCTSRGAQTEFIHTCLNECVYYEGGSVIPPTPKKISLATPILNREIT